jgi:D-alanyl-D-alanine carboxypeptidase
MNRLFSNFVFLTAATLLSSAAMARTELNSMCYLEDRNGAKVTGTNLENMYELASVSKVVTSFWAVDVLGPDFRFVTRIFIDPAPGGYVDVHVSGGWDPYFGREMTHFLMSELDRLGYTKIRTLSFDEDFSLFWSVREKPTWSIDPSTHDIETTLKQKVRFSKAEYTATRVSALKVGVKMQPTLRLTVQQVRFLSQKDFRPDIQTKEFGFESAPLHSYLKEMNRNSNNHVADHLFEFLGGAKGFQEFIKKRLNLNPNDIRFINGSGDKLYVKDEKNQSQKEYNESSCEALVQIIQAIRTDLVKTKKYDLEDVMAVSGLDPQTTLGGRYAGKQVSGAVIAKTGSVNPAITLAGMISTEQGEVYFGILYKTRSPADWNNARNQIRDKVVGLMNKFGGKDVIDDYKSERFLPFDSQSQLKQVVYKKP